MGPNRLDGAYAWNTVVKLSIPLAFGSDFPVESPDPFPGLMAAVSREDARRRVYGMSYDEWKSRYQREAQAPADQSHKH